MKIRKQGLFSTVIQIVMLVAAVTTFVLFGRALESVMHPQTPPPGKIDRQPMKRSDVTSARPVLTENTAPIDGCGWGDRFALFDSPA